MRIIPFLSALAASLQAQTFIPIHGCEWVPQYTSITNFTFVDSPANASTPDSVQWRIPAFGISCNLTSQSATGSTTTIGSPGTNTYVPCKATSSDPTTGTFLVSADDESGINATLRNVGYAQCAADIYAFHYEANFALLCETDEGGSKTCVTKGNATAVVTGEEYLPPIRNPPPPPWSPPGV
ncbi:hypothetical protein EK21DRAFT_109263 [Setomelanomma holmii]|uniref:AA1-like domain-containing protein n=1 Tax=Setomelanomma holmii TaxID=210430 RepID=A0A9P4HF51_9PLEO|nr:hypothetical protein EK21DRAFT_109263 [Setomelanomma holmii]